MIFKFQKSLALALFHRDPVTLSIVSVEMIFADFVVILNQRVRVDMSNNILIFRFISTF
jgi:hypothetical protein